VAVQNLAGGSITLTPPVEASTSRLSLAVAATTLTPPLPGQPLAVTAAVTTGVPQGGLVQVSTVVLSSTTVPERAGPRNVLPVLPAAQASAERPGLATLLPSALSEFGRPLADVLPFDVTTLERGLEQFLQQFERLTAATLQTGRSALTPWLATAAAAALVGELARRQLRRRQREDPFVSAFDDPSSSWHTSWAQPFLKDRS
jgi:hypothetical protein